MELNNLIRAAIFCAVAIGMGFSLMFIPNIELITESRANRSVGIINKAPKNPTMMASN